MLKYAMLAAICTLTACASSSSREASQSDDAALRSLAGLSSPTPYQPLFVSRTY